MPPARRSHSDAGGQSSAAPRKLATFVYFHGDDPAGYGPGDELPADRVAELDAAAKAAGLERHPAFAE